MAGSHLSIVFSCSAIEVEETPWAEPVARRIFGWLKAQDVHADRQMVLYRHTRTKEAIFVQRYSSDCRERIAVSVMAAKAKPWAMPMPRVRGGLPELG